MKTLNSLILFDNNLANVSKKTTTSTNFSIPKIKKFAKLFFENTIFKASLLSFFSFSFFASFLSFGSNSFLIAGLICSVALIIFVKHKFSDFLYDLSTIDSLVRQKFFERKWPWISQITENIFLGALPLKNLNHEKIFKEKNITSILSMIEEKETAKKTLFTTPIPLSYWSKNNFNHMHIQTKDRYPISKENLLKAADFIQNQVLKNKKIYVHCTAGRARSAMAIIAYLLKYKKMNLKEAFDFLKSKRKVVLVNSSQKEALKAFNASLLTNS